MGKSIMDNLKLKKEVQVKESIQELVPEKNIFESRVFIGITWLVLVTIAGFLLWFQFQEKSVIVPADNGIQDSITIGVLRYLPVHDAIVDGLKDSLSKMGYSNVTFIISDVGFTEEKTRGFAKELISQDVDIIFALASVSAKVAVEETAAAGRTDIPIVMSHALNTLRLGIIESYQSSGNNLTGIEVNFQELTGKKLEFLKQINPDITKIGVFDVSNEPGRAFTLIKNQLNVEAPKLGVEIIWYPIESQEAGPALTQEIRDVLGKIKQGDIDAYVHNGSTLLGHANDKQLIIDSINALQVPSVWVTPTEVRSGGLMTYQYDLLEMGQQGAIQVDKVLRGVNPTDIPIEFAQTQKLFLNFSTIQKAGVLIPEDFLELVDVRVE